MLSEPYFTDEVSAVLAALAESGSGRGPEYLAALRHVALALKATPPGEGEWIHTMPRAGYYRVVDAEKE